MLTLGAQFSLQRARFGLWGESVGLVPNPNDGCRLRYDKNLDRQDIRPGVERILHNIRSLLDEAGRVDERYGLKADTLQGSEVSDSRGMSIFKGSFERFKNRIRKHQKETSSWNITRWAIHDAKKFEDMINRLEKFVDGLESITKSLGLLEQQHARLREEIEIISDVESLRLLRDASSSHRSSQRDISDTASRRLIVVAESVAEQRTHILSSSFPGTTESFTTAPSRPSAGTESLPSEDRPLPGAWPKSVKSDAKEQSHHGTPTQRPQKPALKPSPSCAECSEEHYKCVIEGDKDSCTRCIQMRRGCSLVKEVVTAVQTTKTAVAKPGPAAGLPQNQRLVSSLKEAAKIHKPLSFAAGDAHYGEQLKSIKEEDCNYWMGHSGKLLGLAHSSAAKRMFIELRDIREGKVPFVSAAPLNDRLDKVLASIEGPPETPYEGGVFWITVKLSDIDPHGPPLMRFHTRIYHPNVSPRGDICADYKEKWTHMLSAGAGKVKGQTALWYRGSRAKIEWSLGALLTALCGLLATPNVEDPLVPEIAQKYLEDYDGYCENARIYTKKFATAERPSEKDLLFFEASATSDDILVMSPPNTQRDGSAIRLRPLTRLRSFSDSSDSDDYSIDDNPESQSEFSSLRKALEDAIQAAYTYAACLRPYISLKEMLQKTRDCLKTGEGVDKSVTDIQICYSLLQESSALLPLEAASAQLQKIMRENLTSQIAKLLSTTLVYVLSPTGPDFRYKIFFVFKVNESKRTYWHFSQTMRAFEELDRAINKDRDSIAAEPLNSHLRSYTMDLDDEETITDLLTTWLSDLLHYRANRPSLLKNTHFLDFIRPSFYNARSEDKREVWRLLNDYHRD